MKEILGSKMIDVYKSQFKEFGDSPASLGCPKGRQHLRFKALTKNVTNGSLLDFGCGFGDLSSYLEQSKIDVEYHGCDVMQEFLSIAKKNRPNNNFYLTQIGESLKDNYDFIVASGTFNFLYSKDKKEHISFVYKTIESLFNCCNHSLSVDFLSSIVDYAAPDVYHQDIAGLIDFISSKLSRRFQIDHSYMPYEFCIHIFEEQEVLRPDHVFKISS